MFLGQMPYLVDKLYKTFTKFALGSELPSHIARFLMRNFAKVFLQSLQSEQGQSTNN